MSRAQALENDPPATAPSDSASRGDDVVVIRPPAHLAPFNIKEIYHHRQLLWGIAWTKLRSRFDELILGFFWAMARPVIMTLVFTFIKRKSMGDMGVEMPYPLYFYAGAICWFYFTETAANVANSMVSSKGLMKKLYVPTLIPPIAELIASLHGLLISTIPIWIMMVYYGIFPDWRIIFLPAVILMWSLLALGTGLLFSGLGAYNKDFHRLLGILLYVGLFCSPVIYSPELVPEGARSLFMMNPAVGLLTNARACFYSISPHALGELVYSFGFILVLLAVGTWLFKRAELVHMDRL
jgi:lipopolysaccharide transport system permease protein